MILAAIDVGSNAARLLIMQVTEFKRKPQFSKLELYRVPLRLGFDVFQSGVISPEKTEMFVESMKAFSHLMKAYKVEAYKAYATSAMRDALNAKEIISQIKRSSGINLEVITGDMEANLVYENHVAENMDKNNSYLYIDVGGGSTELSFFSSGILIFKKSFNIGTIRLLKKQVSDGEWDEMKITVKAVTKNHSSVIAIGSGGNINKVFSISKSKEGKSIDLPYLKSLHKALSGLTVQQRMKEYVLKADRADVIVPALEIYINAMTWAGAREIYVPKIGLADGLVHHLYDEIKEKQ